MIRATIVSLVLASAFVACSGYEGGGDVRVVPVTDAGAVVVTDGGGPDSDSGPAPHDAGSDSPAPKKDSVIAYYPLDGSGADEGPSMRHLDLEISNGSFQSGRVGNALAVTTTGTTAARSRNDPELAFGDRDFTLQAWIIAGAAAISIGTQQFGVADAPGWLLQANQSTVAFQSNDPRGALQTSVSGASFHHYVVRRSAGTIELFVDGTTRVQFADSPPIGIERPLTIQRLSTSTSGGTPRIDEVVIWSRALTDAEIIANYTRGMSSQPPVLTE